MTSILDLIDTGAVGPVVLGSTIEVVRQVLGVPTDTSVQREPLILKYDALEVTLGEGRVVLIHLELDERLPAFLDSGGVSRATSIDELRRHLDTRGVQLQRYEALTFAPDQLAFRSEASGVVVVFDEHGVYSISSSAS